MTATARERLIRAALDLFNERGYRAAGIDAILERAGVAKMSLYNNFAGKDDLIVEALRQRASDWMAWFVPAVESHAARAAESRGDLPTATDRLIAVFDVLADWFAERSFNGCGFIRACGEFPDPADPVHIAGVSHKDRIEAALLGWCQEAGARDPQELSRALFVIVAGAIVAAQMTATAQPARDAGHAARALLSAHGVRTSRDLMKGA